MGLVEKQCFENSSAAIDTSEVYLSVKFRVFIFSWASLEGAWKKYVFALLICFLSSLSQAEKCTMAELVKLDDITNCAKHGDRTAQYLLGEIYFWGKEVPKNFGAAFEWTSKAAHQGDKDAQASLGFDYFNGWGTKKDHVLAYMWWSLSIVNNEEPITRKNLDDLEQELSVADLARAQKMASNWLASHR